MKYLSMKYSWLQTSVVLLMTFVVGLAAISTAAIAAPQVPSPKTSPAKAKSTKAGSAKCGSAAGKPRTNAQGRKSVKAGTPCMVKAPPSLVSSPSLNRNSTPYSNPVTQSAYPPLPTLPYPDIDKQSSGKAIPIPPTSVNLTRTGNIAPYRKDILYGISQNWHPVRKVESVVVLLVIAHDGNLLNREIVISSGSKRTDKEILKAIDETQFLPLPEWYKGKSLTFKVELSKNTDNNVVENSNQTFSSLYRKGNAIFPKPMILLGNYPKDDQCALSSNAHFAKTNISSSLSRLYLWRNASVLSPALMHSITRLSDASNLVDHACIDGNQSQSSDSGIGAGMVIQGFGAGAGEGGGEVVRPPVAVMTNSRGNIAPYRKEILYRIALNWHPKRPVESVSVILNVSRDGTLLEKEIAVSSGSKRSDKEVMEAIEKTQFPPLPGWYKEQSLQFKLELSKTLD